MKKVIAIFLMLSILMLSSCSDSKDEVIDSLGEYKTKEYFNSGDFQDYTDYAKYSYEDVDFSNNQYFSNSSLDDTEFILHIENFENCIEEISNSDPKNEVVLGYDFDLSLLSADDYFYIYDDPDYPKLGSYKVYYFDTETQTLYYFRSNI